MCVHVCVLMVCVHIDGVRVCVCVCVCVCCTAKQAVRVFDGDDAVKRGAFRLISVPRVTKKEELVVRPLISPLSP